MRGLRWFGRAALLVLALPIGWFLAGLIGALIPGPHARFDGPQTVTIGLIPTAIHYDLLLPLDARLRDRFAFAQQAGVGVQNPDAGWLLVGWGARDFYQSAGTYADIPLSAVVKGITGDAAILRLEAWAALPLTDIPQARALHLTEAGYAALLDHITTELGPAPEIVAAPGLTATDAFFAARTPFHILNTCNVWIGAALRAAGVRLGIWTPTPQALRLSLMHFG